MNSRLFSLAVPALVVLSAVFCLSSCADKQLPVDTPVELQLATMTADDVAAFGSFPGIKGFTAGESQRAMSCDEWFIFRRDAGEFRLAVTCYPYFNFDTVYAKVAVNSNFGFTEGAGASVSGIYGYMHARKASGMNWEDAEITADFSLDDYSAPFSATDADGDGMFDITMTWEGVDYYTDDFKVEISNINDEGTHIYRAVMKVAGTLADDYWCIYWQDDI